VQCWGDTAVLFRIGDPHAALVGLATIFAGTLTVSLPQCSLETTLSRLACFLAGVAAAFLFSAADAPGITTEKSSGAACGQAMRRTSWI
jgi:hypothetical protein